MTGGGWAQRQYPATRPAWAAAGVRVVKRRPPVWEGTLCSLEVQRRKKTRHPGTVESDLALPPALQGTGGCSQGNFGSTSGLPAPNAQALLLAESQGQVLPGLHAEIPPNVAKQAGPRGLFIAFHTPLPFQVWDQSLPQTPANETKSPPSCVHAFLSFKVLSLLQGLVCVMVVCFVLVNEVRFVQLCINEYIKVEKNIHCQQPKKKKKEGGTKPDTKGKVLHDFSYMKYL